MIPLRPKTGFLRHRSPLFDGIFAVLDLLTILASFLLCHLLYFGDIDLIPERWMVLLFLLLAAYLVFITSGLYRSKRIVSFGDEATRLFLSWIIVILLTGLFAFLTKIADDVSRLWFGWSAVLSFFALIGLRLVLRLCLAWLRRQGYNFRSVVVAGAADQTLWTADQIGAHRDAGLKVTGVFSDAPEVQSGSHDVLGGLADLPGFVEEQRRQGTPVDQVWIALPLSMEAQCRGLIAALSDSSVDICYIPSLFGMQLLSGSVDHIGELAVVNLSENRISSVGEWLKTAFDFVVSAVAVVLLAPIMLVIALAIKFDSPGSVLFRQHRYGIDGKEIEVWKFRTMTVQENNETVIQVRPNDDRVTAVGAFLRRYSLDELPQFYNVLQGRMSIVGPRPHAVAHNEEFRRKIDGYMMRHRIKPGITGWAQVNGWRGETDTLEKMEKRVEYDLEYIRNWSAWLDLKIIFLTVVRGFTGKNVY